MTVDRSAWLRDKDFVRVRRSGTLILLVVAVSALTWSRLFGPGPGVLGVTAGLDRYWIDAGELRANIWLTNANQAHVTIALECRCMVETPGGLTNYVAGVTNGWLYMRPHQGVVLSSSRFAVPLPTDARRWKFSLAARRQTGKERFTSLLVRWGVMDYRELHRHPMRILLGPDPGIGRADEVWEKIQSGWIEAPGLASFRSEM